jgi:hypothetical protein
MQKRLYLDTSVFGGYFDIEFDFWTKILFDQIYNEQYFVLYSYLTDNELLNAPLKVQELVKTIPIDKIQFIEISDKALLDILDFPNIESSYPKLSESTTKVTRRNLLVTNLLDKKAF